MRFKIIERMFFVMKKGVMVLVSLVGLVGYVIYGMEDKNFQAENLVDDEIVFFDDDSTKVVVQRDEGILEAPQARQLMNANEGSVPNTGSEEALDTEEDTQIVEEVVTEAGQPTQQEQEEQQEVQVQAQVPTPAPVQNNTQSQAPAPAQSTSTVQAPASNNQAEVQAQKERERAMAEQAERERKANDEAIKKAAEAAEAAAKAAAAKAAEEAARPKYAPNSVYINGAKVPGSVNGNVVTGVSSSVIKAGSVMITDGSGNGRTVSIGAQYEVSKVDNRTFDTDEDMTAILQGSYGVVFISSINSYVNLVAQGY